ncbi:hypothetical protein vBRpoSV10_128 [Ruegeria phage vB_RpoS-V10]|nr:hypothetical protein vBRpoSV10_128 [Ruegeria phage vB_RpoS-V10]
MFNPTLTRKIRAETVPVLRRRLRKKDEEIAELRRRIKSVMETKNQLYGQIMSLRARLERRKEVKIPESMLNEIMAEFIKDLGQELTKRTLDKHPAEKWTPFVRRAAQMMLQEAYDGHHSTFCLQDSFRLFVEDRMEDGDLDFTFKVENISNHKVLPQHVRKAAIMRDPHEKMYFLDNLPSTYGDDSAVSNCVQTISVFR